jgi:hypothetical protein
MKRERDEDTVDQPSTRRERLVPSLGYLVEFWERLRDLTDPITRARCRVLSSIHYHIDPSYGHSIPSWLGKLGIYYTHVRALRTAWEEIERLGAIAATKGRSIRVPIASTITLAQNESMVVVSWGQPGNAALRLLVHEGPHPPTGWEVAHYPTGFCSLEQAKKRGLADHILPYLSCEDLNPTWYQIARTMRCYHFDFPEEDL